METLYQLKPTAIVSTKRLPTPYFLYAAAMETLFVDSAFQHLRLFQGTCCDVARHPHSVDHADYSSLL